MKQNAYTTIPQPDITGGAGSGAPMYRETRYKTYVPKLRQRRQKEEA